MLGLIPWAIGDLADRRILGLLFRSLVVTLLIFVAIGAVLGWALIGSDPCSAIGYGDVECRFDPMMSTLSAISITLLAIWFLFPAVALGVMCAYVDRIAAIVEARHYPLEAAHARPAGIAGTVGLGLRSAARVLFYNLVALPFYIVLLFTGLGPLILFVLVNGIAFGRDLGEMVAARHGDRAERRAWLADTRLDRALIGSIVTGLFLIPFVNLLAPIFGATMTTHLYLRSRRR